MHARTEGLHHTPPRTPTAVTSAAHNLVGEIHDIYGALSKLSSLAPGVQVNALLTRLVSLCIIPYDEDFVTEFFNIAGTDTLCSQLRPLCAIAEGELESYWARKIISESSSTEGTSLATHRPADTTESLQLLRNGLAPFYPPFRIIKTTLTCPVSNAVHYPLSCPLLWSRSRLRSSALVLSR